MRISVDIDFFVIHLPFYTIHRILVSHPKSSAYVCLIKTNNMETINTETQINNEVPYCKPRQKSRLGRILGGLVIIAAGGFLFARNAGVEFPEWLFSGPMFLFTLGLFFLAKNAFRRPGGLILMTIGGFLLLGRIFPALLIGQFFWPVFIIIAGAFMIFKPKRKHHWQYQMHHQQRWEQCRR